MRKLQGKKAIIYVFYFLIGKEILTSVNFVDYRSYVRKIVLFVLQLNLYLLVSFLFVI